MQPNEPQDPELAPQQLDDATLADPTQTEIPIPPPKSTPLTMASLKPYILAGAGAMILVLIAAFFLGTIVGKSQTRTVTKVTGTSPTPWPATPTRAFTQSENPITVNWNVYTNKAIGFQMKFPPRYARPGLEGKNEYVTGGESEDVIIFGTIDTVKDISDGFTLTLKPFTGSLSDYLQAYPPKQFASNSAVSKKDVIVGGNKAVWYQDEASAADTASQHKAQAIYFVGNDYAFELLAPGPYSSQELEYVFSSFTFTK